MDADVAARIRQSTSLLVDTNILLLAVVHSIDSSLPARFKRTRDRLMPGDGDLLLRTLSLARRTACTSHVLAETSNLLGHLASHHREAAMNYLVQWPVTNHEMHVPARLINELETPIAVRLGIADAAITHLSRDGVLVLTDDAVLANAIYEVGGNVLNFMYLRGLG